MASNYAETLIESLDPGIVGDANGVVVGFIVILNGWLW
jgi:hypothetical protein